METKKCRYESITATLFFIIPSNDLKKQSYYGINYLTNSINSILTTIYLLSLWVQSYTFPFNFERAGSVSPAIFVLFCN